MKVVNKNSSMRVSLTDRLICRYAEDFENVASSKFQESVIHTN